LNHASFPQNDDDRIFFGDKEVAHLAEICNVDKSETVAEFRIYKIIYETWDCHWTHYFNVLAL
jgi:hypothetical protein